MIELKNKRNRETCHRVFGNLLPFEQNKMEKKLLKKNLGFNDNESKQKSAKRQTQKKRHWENDW